MFTVSRRQVLRGGLAAAGLLALGPAGVASAEDRDPARGLSALSWLRGIREPDSLPFPELPAGTDTLPQIEHILVLMMENHSYDNYLGMLGRRRGRWARGDGFQLARDGLPTAVNPYPDGRLQRAFHMPTTCQNHGVPSQEWNASHIQFDDGRNDGFVRSPSGPTAMGYWTEDDLPFYYSLADHFPLADRWFSSVLGQTYPNRRFLMAGTAAGMVDDVLSQVPTPPPNGTIFDRLDAHGITWRDYYTTLPSSLLWVGDPSSGGSSNVVNIDQFFTDAARGDLPGFALIEPNFGNQSEEDPQDIVVGEAFASQVINAVFRSPAWPRTLLVWCYDEHGGYFDHVPPPKALPPDDIQPLVDPSVAYDGYARYGFRVPAVVVSPWSRPWHVTSVVHDHTSVLAMIERKWNLPAMTFRDANAADLMDFVDLRWPAFGEPPSLAAPDDGPAQLACEITGPGQIPPPGSIIQVPPHRGRGRGRDLSEHATP